MAVRTYAQLISDVSAYLITGGRTTASQVRTLATNIVDTLFNSGNGSGGRPYKVYTAILTQTGTDAPVATVLENTLGGTVVWSYGATGIYLATLASAFTANKTVLMQGNTNGVVIVSFVRNTTSELQLSTYTEDNGTMLFIEADDLLATCMVEIRVYP